MSIYGNPVMMGGSGGGGGSTNVLSGKTTPTAAQGNNGAMYLQYSDAGLKNATGQYINTGYNGKDNSRYVIDFMLAEGQTIKYPTPFGARSAPNAVDNASYLHLGNGSNYTSGYVAWGNYQAATSLGASAIIGKRTIIELSKSAYAYTVDGQRTEIPITGGTVTDTTPIGIFSAICNGSLLQDVGISGMVLYSFTIYEGDTLVHRYVPALDSNDVACVYDEVTSQYIYHSGGGTLEYIPEGSISATYAKVNSAWQDLIGTDIDNIDLGGGGGGIPSGPSQPTGGSDGDLYAQTFPVAIGVNYVEYLESSGTQYINTGITGNQNTGYLYDQETTIAAWGFGARESAQSRAVVITSDGTSTTVNTFDLGSDRKIISSIPARRTMLLKNRNLYINGVLKAKYGMPSNFTTPNPLLLFGVYNGGTVALTTGGFKVYRAAVFSNSIPIADYLPCLDGNGVACMWDNVAGQYVYNTGTGTFAYGSSVTPDPLEPILWQKQSGTWVVIGG